VDPFQGHRTGSFSFILFINFDLLLWHSLMLGREINERRWEQPVYYAPLPKHSSFNTKYDAILCASVCARERETLQLTFPAANTKKKCETSSLSLTISARLYIEEIGFQQGCKRAHLSFWYIQSTCYKSGPCLLIADNLSCLVIRIIKVALPGGV